MRQSRRQIEALGIAEGFLDSGVLFALNELGVFGILADGPRSALEVASTIGVDGDALARLLNAGVSVGLLRLEGEAFSNAPVAEDVLVPGRPGYLGNWMRWMSRLMEAWSDLRESVRDGKPAVDSAQFLGGDPEFTRDFVMAMDDYAALRGSEIVRNIDLSGGRSLLDVGGGPGTYAILFTKRWPDLRATIFDLPEVGRIATQNAAAAGVGDRVSVVGGSYREDDLGEGYDVVFISDVLHQEDPETCTMILSKAFAALRPEGRLIVQGMFLDEDRIGPRWVVMHSLILLLVYGGGRAYTVGETVRMMESVGFKDARHGRLSLLNMNSLLMAERP